jgi:FKBP-type peptidyl-prolyl cis-trans isomerase FklB
VSGLIKGWQEALTLMKTGAKWQVWVPPKLAYGVQGAPGRFGPNETLIFEIELLEVK